MKILHIGISEHLGGIETYLFKIASHIDLNEYQFDFLTYPGITPCYYDELTQLGCHFQRVTPRRESLLKFRREFNDLLRREQYDIIHCHLNTLSFTDPIRLALRCKTKVIAHSHNGQFVGNGKSKILHVLHYLTLPRNKITMLAVSDVAGKWMFGKNADFTVVNNGVDLDRFHYTEVGRNSIRKEFGIGDARLIVHTGAFRPQKNHAFLIDVFEEVHKIEPDTVLLMVGTGDGAEEIYNKTKKMGLQDNVIFAGQRSDIPAILSAGDLFLFPSLYEGFPNAMIEAEATGLYCIASDTITEQARINGLCEYMSLNESAETWASVVHRCTRITDCDNCVEGIRNAGLDVKCEIERLTELYNNVVAGK